MQNDHEYPNSNDSHAPQEQHESLPKRKGRKRKFLTFLLIILLAGFVYAHMNGGFPFSVGGLQREITSISKAKNFTVQMSSQDIVVKSTSEKEAYLVLQGSKSFVNNLSIEVDSNRVTITRPVTGNGKAHSFMENVFQTVLSGQNQIILYLPEKQFNTIELITSSGSITVEDVNCKEAIIRSSSGSQRITDSVFKTLDVTASSGSIHLDEVEASSCRMVTSSGNQKISDASVKQASFFASSGNVTADELSAANVSVTTSSGNADFSFEDINKINFDGISASGNITLALDSKLELNITANKTVRTDFVTHSKAKNNITLTTSSGSLKIKQIDE